MIGGHRMRVAGLVTVFLVAPASGCGGDAPTAGAKALRAVSGRVTSGGKPAAGVEVRLHPMNRSGDASAPRPAGTTDKDGRFMLKTDGADGAPDGQYQATLAWPAGRGGADRLGGAFDDPQGSGLVAIIDDSTTELAPFEVADPARKPGGR